MATSPMPGMLARAPRTVVTQPPQTVLPSVRVVLASVIVAEAAGDDGGVSVFLPQPTRSRAQAPVVSSRIMVGLSGYGTAVTITAALMLRTSPPVRAQRSDGLQAVIANALA